MYYAAKLLDVEAGEREGKSLWKEVFTVKRNRRAAQSSFFVMFMQQFCGVNVIAYYSTQIFQDAGFSLSNALLVSLDPRCRHVFRHSHLLGLQLHHRLQLASSAHGFHSYRRFLLVRLLEFVRYGLLLLPAARDEGSYVGGTGYGLQRRQPSPRQVLHREAAVVCWQVHPAPRHDAYGAALRV